MRRYCNRMGGVGKSEPPVCVVKRCAYNKLCPYYVPISSNNNYATMKMLFNYLLVMIAFTAMTNLLDPFSMVSEHWKEDDFGDKFFPFDMDLDNKRILAGFMELACLLLILNTKTRSMGVAGIAAMYGRATFIHSQIAQIEISKTLFVGSGFVSALLLLINVHNSPTKTKKKTQ